MKELVDLYTDDTLAELAVLISEEFGRSVSRATVGLMMQRLRLHAQEKGLVSSVGSRPGVQALRACEGGTTGEIFLSFVREVLVPYLAPVDVVVVDYLGDHIATGVRAAIEGAGGVVVYLPPYSRDLNPIQMCWSKVKSIFRLLPARSISTLKNAIIDADSAVTSADAKNWVRSCRVRLC